ncbi:MAG: hypothetical protein KDC66_15035 [Phaeodactylibacter sp.]|nr:hypothetical protein [Phaeodactylibacter sp.]MCB9272998.1 mevalonate kinase [Lewinellaceae bacterium]
MQRYYGKLLLFGEHTILKGSRALAMPLSHVEGHWAYTPDAIPPHLNLENFLSYLQKHSDKGELTAGLQLSAFEREVNKGMYFESSIPVGYGAGSSGALCAAVYERFAFRPIHRDDEAHYVLLKRQLAQIESFFHGSSSGADPLICYLGQAVLLFPDGHAQRVHPPKPRAEGRFFLLDTGISRKTGPLVERFLEKSETPLFRRSALPALLPATQAAIDAYLEADGHNIMAATARISGLQLQYLPELIPSPFEKAWQAGLESSGAYALKLCGAGGGGFILGYTLDAEKANSLLAPLTPVYLSI